MGAVANGSQETPERTGRQQEFDGRSVTWFKPGQSGNPAGRPRGSRNQLADNFIGDLYDHWLENGAQAIRATFETEPATYLKIVAGLMPKDVTFKVETPTDPAELDRRIAALATALNIALGRDILDQGPAPAGDAGSGEAGATIEAVALPAVSQAG